MNPQFETSELRSQELRTFYRQCSKGAKIDEDILLLPGLCTRLFCIFWGGPLKLNLDFKNFLDSSYGLDSVALGLKRHCEEKGGFTGNESKWKLMKYFLLALETSLRVIILNF